MGAFPIPSRLWDGAGDPRGWALPALASSPGTPQSAADISQEQQKEEAAYCA